MHTPHTPDSEDDHGDVDERGEDVVQRVGVLVGAGRACDGACTAVAIAASSAQVPDIPGGTLHAL